MSEESIINELLAELEELRNSTNKALSDTQIVESLSDFQYEELVDKLKLRGILISEGVWNGIKYPWNQIKEMAKQFKKKLSNLPWKVEHGRTENFKDKVVGKNTKININDFLKAIEYEAEIDDEDAIKDIISGKFRASSLKFQLDAVTKDSEKLAMNLVPLDNSLTEYPACKVCNVFTITELSDKESNQVNYFGIKLFKKEYSKKSTGDEKYMEYVELKENEVLAFPEEPDTEEWEDIELEVMPEDLARKRKRGYIRVRPGKYPKRIKRRKGYYYYPYGYPVPYYYWYYHPYYYPYGYYSEIEVEEMGETVYLEGQWKIVKNKKTGKFVVFKATGKKGFGAWKIVGQYDTYEEAKKATQSETLQQKCPACGKEFNTKDELLDHWAKTHEDKYGKYGEFKQSEEVEAEMEELAVPKKCFICGQEVKSKAEFLRHWAEKHEAKYGEYKKAKRLAETIFTDKEFRKNMKKMLQELSEEEESKGEAKEEASQEEPKEQETPKEEVPKEEAKEEKPKEEVKEEAKEEKEEVKETPRTPKDVYEEMKKEGMITPEIAAELLIKSCQKEEI